MVYENRKLLTGLKLTIQAKIKKLYFILADNAQKLLLSWSNTIANSDARPT